MRDGSLLRTTHFAIALALGATVPAVHAQGLYRIVGADGRVTYSDQAPTAGSQTGRVDVMRGASGIIRPGAGGEAGHRREAAAPAAALRTVAPASALRTVAPASALPAGTAASAPVPATKAPDPSVEAAVIDVLGMEDIVRRTETICVSTLPAAARRYSGAVDDWARRNARSVLAARRVLTREFDVERRDRVEAGVRALSAARFGAVADAPEARMVAWCDRSVAEMAAGQLDVHGRLHLGGPPGEPSAR